MAKSDKQINKENNVAVPDDTHPVLAYRVGQLEKATSEGFVRLEAKLDNLRDGFVSHDQLAEAIKLGDSVHADHERRIAKLEGWNTWLVRIVVGAVVLAVLAMVIGSHIKVNGG